jgi:hypothetical protein
MCQENSLILPALATVSSYLSAYVILLEITIAGDTRLGIEERGEAVLVTR